MTDTLPSPDEHTVEEFLARNLRDAQVALINKEHEMALVIIDSVRCKIAALAGEPELITGDGFTIIRAKNGHT